MIGGLHNEDFEKSIQVLYEDNNFPAVTLNYLTDVQCLTNAKKVSSTHVKSVLRLLNNNFSCDTLMAQHQASI